MAIHVMHIMDKLSVSGSEIHGVSKAIERWIPCFNSQEIRFSICSLRAPEEAAQIFERQGVPVFFLGRSKFDPRTFVDLLKLIEQEKPDILHLSGYGSTTFGRLVGTAKGLPNIVHEHAVFPRQPLYLTLVDALLSPLTTTAIACSEPVRDFMVAVRKVQPQKVETLFYGLPLTEFKAPAQEVVDQERSKLGIQPGDKVICNVGRLDTQKGQIYLLQAATSILKEFPNTRFLLVGAGPDLEMLQSFAQSEGIADQVIFTGYREDVPTLLALADVVAMPSLWEGLPIALVEAMNMSKPVVGTTAGGMGSAIDDQKTGFIIPFKDCELLANKLIFLLKNSEVAQSMGSEAQEKCNQYDIAHSYKRLREIYLSLTSQRTNLEVSSSAV